MVSVERYCEKSETIADMISGAKITPITGQRSRYVLRDFHYNPMTGMGFFDHQSYQFWGDGILTWMPQEVSNWLVNGL